MSAIPADDELLDVIVVGGSQAGLAMAWHLARRQLRFVVLEAGPELGHTWRSRWDSLRLFTPAQYDALPGLPFPGAADTYPGKDAVAGYLADYAAAFDLPVRLNARVTRLSRAEDGFEASTGDAVFRARQVVVATGPFQVPFTPPAARGLGGSVTQLHSAAYRNPLELPDGPVLVVGGGNSGFQIAAELAATRPVDLSISTKSPMLPQRPGGKDLFWWLSHLGLIRVTGQSRPGRRMSSREFVVGSSRRGLAAAGVRFRPAVDSADERTVRFADGSSVDVGVVVWATGYRSDYAWIDIPGVTHEGKVAQQRGVTEVPGLYFLGLPWQHTRGSALLGFVHQDATYLDGLIASNAARFRAAPGRPQQDPLDGVELHPSRRPDCGQGPGRRGRSLAAGSGEDRHGNLANSFALLAPGLGDRSRQLAEQSQEPVGDGHVFMRRNRVFQQPMGEDHILAGNPLKIPEAGNDGLALVNDHLQAQRARGAARAADTQAALARQLA
jgi:putative flavoprotein involved in K+ transport